MSSLRKFHKNLGSTFGSRHISTTAHLFALYILNRISVNHLSHTFTATPGENMAQHKMGASKTCWQISYKANFLCLGASHVRFKYNIIAHSKCTCPLWHLLVQKSATQLFKPRLLLEYLSLGKSRTEFIGL